ncbi:cellulose binding domain-containing protein [Micromonospora sp. NPDC049257]|uniref:cellulose binding domain-containing protein n=1 Tax=Micromonospora sp. NPDC049257 TaxID=3155771 RepID=UPI00343F18D5
MSGMRRAQPRAHGAGALASSPWVVVATGVLVMVVLLIVALASYRSRGPAFEARPADPVPAYSLPGSGGTDRAPVAANLPEPVVPGLTPRRTDPLPVELPADVVGGDPSGGGGAVSSPPDGVVVPPDDPGAPPAPPAPQATPPAPPAPPSSPMTGRFSVRDSWNNEAFIGEVLLHNRDRVARPWTVRLVPPAGSRLVTSWVEGAPQGTPRMSGGVFTYTSGVNVAPGASVPLRFHFENTGGSIRPSRCTVDGVACSGL